MSQRVLDEREHRRGLVLGLTLAEILILLLFMLLLALGVRLKEIERTTVRVDPKIKELITRYLPRGEGRLEEQNAQALTSVFEFAIWLNQEFPALNGLGEIRDLVDAGTKIDPNDPPEAIRRAVRMLKGLGRGPKSSQVPKTGDKEPKLNPPSKDPASPNSAANVTGSLQAKKGAHDWPPIITLSEASGYFFATGSADVTPDFQVKLSTEVVDRLVKTISEFHVDVIEVVGHTDERPYNVRPPKQEPPDTAPSTPLLRRSPRASNLDTTLIPFLKGEAEKLVAADNAGLGLARAASVARILAKHEGLANVRILPLSGGQLILVGDKLSPGSPGDAKERRRIEIRARRRVAQDARLRLEK